MHILFLSDNFPPETNAPATRIYEHAVHWVKAGHEVTVITCAPNFPEGKLYDGYTNRWRTVETWDGIRVVRMKTYISANEGFILRTIDYLSYMVTGFFGGLLERRPDVVVATSPQFFAALGGWLLSVFKRRPFVFELRDLWPASIVAVGAMRKSMTIKLLEKLELFLYARATAIIAVTQAFKDDLIARGISAERIHVVRNGVDMERFSAAPAPSSMRSKLGLEGKFVVGYLGTHGMAHALDHVLDSVRLLRERNDVAFLFVGSGAAKADVDRRIAEDNLQQATSLPRQPRSAMPELNSLCDVALVPLRNSPVFESVLPSKIFECMAMGVPMVVSVPEGEATGLVRRVGSGVTIPPESSSVMAETIVALEADRPRLKTMRDAGLAAAPTFSRSKQAARMLDILERQSARPSKAKSG
ncbi:glycosyl transferase [Salinisphaera orenii MK-B5]|uniref:Glycosyl transferase n=1 Tax=Salinisphaera orenii MK-B5 TaxID=856730 RepID=A0A423PLF8_9GAMM|nr:glycosyltransferase family 4 protein [Salinisphaera orenii]ROO26372.1 glycosyl transferase [Salinisphaera orenii MK-B5]